MKEKIIALIEEVLQLPGGSITEKTKIKEVTEWDSLAWVIIIGEINKQFNINLSLDETAEINSVKELLEKIRV